MKAEIMKTGIISTRSKGVCKLDNNNKLESRVEDADFTEIPENGHYMYWSVDNIREGEWLREGFNQDIKNFRSLNTENDKNGKSSIIQDVRDIMQIKLGVLIVISLFISAVILYALSWTIL